MDSTQVARTFKAAPQNGGSTQVRSASGSAHGCRPLGDGCQCPHPCSVRFERIVAPAAVLLPALAVSRLRQLTPVSVAPTQRRARKQRRSPGPARSTGISPCDNPRDKRGSAAHHMSCTAADVLPRENTWVTLRPDATNPLMCLVPLDVPRQRLVPVACLHPPFP